MKFSLNHVTVKSLSFEQLLSTAVASKCEGIELRNDLNTTLFGGVSAREAGANIQACGLTVFALAEVKSFNYFTERTRSDAIALMDDAVACGAKGVALIPRCDGTGIEYHERVDALHHALTELKPLLQQRSLIGFIEPLGFEHASLRFKSEAVSAIERCDGFNQFQLVHDTFHHHLADEPDLYPLQTGMVHVSGVTDTSLTVNDMRDEHRVLVDDEDRLGNCDQLHRLMAGGYGGPVSMEAFSPLVHQFAVPEVQLRESFAYIAESVNSKLTLIES